MWADTVTGVLGDATVAGALEGFEKPRVMISQSMQALSRQRLKAGLQLTRKWMGNERAELSQDHS
jgi:hypothetical protein